jgi:hypothetical protein
VNRPGFRGGCLVLIMRLLSILADYACIMPQALLAGHDRWVRRLPCQGYNLEVEVSGLKTLGGNTVGGIRPREVYVSIEPVAGLIFFFTRGAKLMGP